MTDLDKLIEAVELGDWVGQFDADLNVKQYKYAAKAYHGSLDAAKALHEALLHGWGYKIEAQTYGAMVSVGKECEMLYSHRGIEPDPARAWLLAILKAYRAQVQQ